MTRVVLLRIWKNLDGRVEAHVNGLHLATLHKDPSGWFARGEDPNGPSETEDRYKTKSGATFGFLARLEEERHGR